MSETQDKPKTKKKDVDALLSEVTAAAPKKAAPKSEAPKAEKAEKAAAKAATSGKTVRIRQVKSGICAPVDQKLTLQGLGLRRIRHEVVRPDTPAVRGLVHKVRHLVAVVGE